MKAERTNVKINISCFVNICEAFGYSSVTRVSPFEDGFSTALGILRPASFPAKLIDL